MASDAYLVTGTGLNWAVPQYWLLDRVPTSSDAAIVQLTAFTIVTEDSPNVTVSSLTVGYDNLDVENILDIEGGNTPITFAAINGGGTSKASLVYVDNAFLELGGAGQLLTDIEWQNAGTTQLAGDSDIFLEGNTYFQGGGSIQLTDQNLIGGGNSNVQLLNVDNDIQGGSIGGLEFSNSGMIESNSPQGATTCTIQASAAGGYFQNYGLVLADNGGAIIFGLDGSNSSIDNYSLIEADGSSEVTRIEIAGDITINQTSPLLTGQIMLAGTDTNFDDIVSDGKIASLTLNGGTLSGAGFVGDSSLFLNVDQQTIVDADNSGGSLILNTDFGAHTIFNAGTLEATNNSSLAIESPVDNTGTVQAIGGTIILYATISDAGLVVVGANGILTIQSDGNVENNVRLTGQDASLVLTHAGSIGGEISGAATGDTIDLEYVSFVVQQHAVWQQTTSSAGTLSIVGGNGTTLATLTLAGHYVSADFQVAADSQNDTLVTLVTPHVVDDLNGDAISDVLWRNSNGALATWLMNGAVIASSGTPTFGGSAVAPDSSWSVAGSGDFNGDGNADILWRQSSSGSLAEWLMNGATIQASTAPTFQGQVVSPDSSWSVAGIGDFNGDGDADILWRQSSTGSLAEWLMNGSAIQASTPPAFQGQKVSPDSSWSVAGIADFNGDGDADILWRQSSTGSLAMWLMNGSAISASASVTSGGSAVAPGSTWSVVGVGDFNGDGDADILWRQSTTGSLAMWLMNGSAISLSATVTSGGTAVAPDATWNVVEVGDFNGGNQAGLLWQQSTTGSLVEWQMNGAQIVSSQTVTSGENAVSPPSSWQVQARPTDFT